MSAAAHVLSGTFRKDRHAVSLATSTTSAEIGSQQNPISPAQRRRALRGLASDARRIVAALLAEFAGWDESTILTLREFARSSVRLEVLHAAAVLDAEEVHREVRTFVRLLKSLELPCPSRDD